MALSSPSAKDFSYPVLNGLGLALFGAWVIYLGVDGQSPNRADLRDDLRLHADNKRRSRWWF
jgi:hypothetical protein